MLLEVTQVPAFGRNGLLQPRKVSADFPATALCYSLISATKTQQIPEAWPGSHGASSNTKQHGMRASQEIEILIHKALTFSLSQWESWVKQLLGPTYRNLDMFKISGFL